MKKNLGIAILAIIFAISLVGCKSTKKAEPKVAVAQPKVETKQVTEPEEVVEPVELGDVNWIVEQISPSFWPSALKNEATMFISFYAGLSRPISLSEIEKIIIFSPRDLWVLEPNDINKVAEIDAKTGKLVVKRLQCANGAVPLGEWTFELKIKSNDSVMKPVEVVGIGETTENTSEGNEDKKTKEIQYIVPKAGEKNQTEALAIPVISSVNKGKDFIEIHFSVNDKRVTNGYFWFDVPGEKYYRDSGSMVDASGKPVNGCRVFSNDGKECVYILRNDEDSKTWFNKIQNIYFVVSDTNRVESPWEERHRSISAGSKITEK